MILQFQPRLTQDLPKVKTNGYGVGCIPYLNCGGILRHILSLPLLPAQVVGGCGIRNGADVLIWK